MQSIIKNFAERAWTGCFKKGVIEFNDTLMLVALQRGLEAILENSEWVLDYKSKKGMSSQEKEKKIEETEKIKGMLQSLDILNEIPLENFIINQKKVDYHFDFDIRNFSQEELLGKLHDIFPNERFHLVPHNAFNGCGNKFMVPGREKCYFFTYNRDPENQ